MPSPFPGMDPYLESPLYWSDFHHELISSVRALIRARLPRGFVARVEERLYILDATVRPDVAIVQRPTPLPAPRGGAAVLERPLDTMDALHADAPLHIRTYADEVREAYIEIVAVNEPGRVVTTIEVLSPANKRAGAGREEYRRKQADLLRSSTSLLEIDLLRGGAHTVASPPPGTLSEPSGRNADYLVSLHRGGSAGAFEVWPISLRDAPPRVAMPLTADIPDIVVDLQVACERAFDAGGYDETLDYSVSPTPPFTVDDAAWADALLREKGYR